MLLLGIDTSGKTASAALYDSNKEMFLAQTSVYTKMTHSQVILPLCNDILNTMTLMKLQLLSDLVHIQDSE